MVDSIVFGPIHLAVTSLGRAAAFWQGVLGMNGRIEDGNLVLGTKTDDLVIVTPSAKRVVAPGYRGLYHVALHIPNQDEFLVMAANLISRGWPIAPTDHTISKSIYLNDPDGLGIEITLETPERGTMQTTETGELVVLGADGKAHSGREPLDLSNELNTINQADEVYILPVGTSIGHIHFHVANLLQSYSFAQSLGFLPGVYSEKYGMADLHCGGDFKHRLALNIWMGENAPRPPEDMAGITRFTLSYRDEGIFRRAIIAQGIVGGALNDSPVGACVLEMTV
jgi:catechol 2,3-dioxygenase